jgi:beta-glucuronidase
LPSRRTRAERSPVGLIPLVLAALVGAVLPSCTPAARAGSLPPTLTMQEHDGFDVAIQNGIPVPTFDRQARRQIELSGAWRVQRIGLSADLSLTDRAQALDDIEAEAAGRQGTEYDDSSWTELEVPGSLNQPPEGDEIGGWYRRTFFVSSTWAGQAATLKFGSANYVADVWINGVHLGFHEGGYTPFAFDVSAHLRPGERNLVAVRVDNPAWGTRNDIVPWGLADWWNYGGLTGTVWIEQTPPTHLVRADVVPHLDGLDVMVLAHRGTTALAADSDATPSPTVTPAEPSLAAASGVEDVAEEVPAPSVRVEVLPAEVGPDNLLEPVASALVADGEAPLVADELPLRELEPGDVLRLDTGFLLGGADHWSPANPALYVLHVTLDDGSGVVDELWTSFGLRHVSIDAERAQLLLNGEPTMFAGVGLHDERISPDFAGDFERSPAQRITDADDLLDQLAHAREVNADLVRAGHTPANPLLMMLADRLGFAVWEEIPLYHYTPLTYGIAMDRGIPQQMLREMALRDMNRPSVLFHGLSNESTGDDERQEALATLHDIDRQIDGTRLTGQAAYASIPDDPTHQPLDVAGFTFYYGVFYGPDAATGTGRALRTAHRTHPDKPVIALEFGRWADGAGGTERQQAVFEDTFPHFALRSSARGGYVGGAVWWTLEDFTTMVPGIAVEHFGLFDRSGEERPAADAARRLFAEFSSGEGPQVDESDVQRAEVARGGVAPDLRLLGYLAYGFAFSFLLLVALLALLLRRGGRAAPRPRVRAGSGRP